MSRASGVYGLLAFLAGALAPTGMAAQVNIEKLRSTEPQEGWSGFVDLSLELRSGNTDLLSVAPSLRLDHARVGEVAGDDGKPVRYPRRLVFLVANYSFSEQGGEKSVNEGFAHLRWTRMVRPRIGWELFGQLETNEFTRLDRRSLVGGGLRAVPVRATSRELALGTGVMFEEERSDPPAEGGEPSREEAVRSTSYVAVRWSWAERVSLTSVLYLQPRLEEPSDFRLLEVASLDVALSERLALLLAVVVRHDNDPLLGVEETDLRLTNGLRWSF